MAIAPRKPYPEVLAEFARQGSRIIQTDASTRYEHIGKAARRPLEPGFIPIEREPLLTAISYYPNESDLSTSQYQDGRRAFTRWGQTGELSDYIAAYSAWLSFREQIKFFRRWEAPLFERLGIRSEETAWLPLVKCPLPARTAVDHEGIDISRDRNLLWDQLLLIQPKLILVQGAVVYDVIGSSLDNLPFVKLHTVQKIPQYPKPEMMESQLESLVRLLRPYIDLLRNDTDHGW